jgi:dimethylaniline monooxygenase (N-oxide forming)
MIPSTAHSQSYLTFSGWYGLTAAKTFLTLEPDTKLAIFDRDRTVGGTWAQDRIYPNLVAQVEHGYFNYPGTPMPKAGATGDNLVTGDMVFKYLDRFADEHDLKRRIHFGSDVERVERSLTGWRLTVNGVLVEAKKLIIATGVTSIENKAPFNVDPDAIPVIHCKRIAGDVPVLTSPDVNHVVLVGAAKSAYDAAYFLSSLGKKITWIIRPNGGGPMPIMPAEVLGMNTITLGSTRLMSYLSPSLMTSNRWLKNFFNSTTFGKWLVKAHWAFITSRADKAAGFGPSAGFLNALKPDIQDAR